MAVNWNRTKYTLDRLNLGDKIKKVGKEFYYQNRRIIHRDSEIDNGVYLGGSDSTLDNPREAIVVDSKKYPMLKELYKKAEKELSKTTKFKEGVSAEIQAEEHILETVYKIVKNAMPTKDEEEVRKLLVNKKIKPDEKVSLDVFITEGVGICRHHALTCGALLELFKKDGLLKGTPRINRNSTYRGGHAWCRYESLYKEEGKKIVYILDVTQGYFGKLEKAPENKVWPYKKPDDI